jgi:hypothetical protein
MPNRLTILCLFFSFNIGAQESKDSSDLLSDALKNVEILSSSLQANNTVVLNRKQFLTLAGALEDPTRLLIKFPGISTVNDQANSIVYRAMPSQYHKWSLYGARILNPNHLGNAGTISDFPSRSAGGVNMMSGQVIGELEFSGSPSGNSLDAISASSNIKLRVPYQNAITTNLSLIGLEAGIDRVSKNGSENIMLNYRYSTVGLLTSLGLDFGGEAINYQDFTAKYNKRLSKGKMVSIYFSGGINSNFKDPIPIDDHPEEYKDLQEINYDAINIITGLSFDRNNSSSIFHNTLNFSFNATDRISVIPTSSPLIITNSKYRNKEILVASKHNFTIKKENLDIGISLEPYFHSIDLVYDYPDKEQEVLRTQIIERNTLHIIPSIITNYTFSEHWNVSSKLGIQSVFSKENNTSFIGQMSLTYAKPGFVSHLKISRASQIYQAEILIHSIEPDFVISNNAELSGSYKGINLTTFYHKVSNIPTSTVNYGFSAFENLDNVPIPNLSFPLVIQSVGKVDVYGMSISINKNVKEINISSNITITDSRQYSQTKTTKAPLDYSHVFNLSLSKKWNIGLQKQFGISTSFHHRGGARQSQVSLETSYDWGYTNFDFDNLYNIRLADYHRMDLRIIYKPSKRSTISLDIQNVMNRENDAYNYYEPLSRQSTLKKQLGMIPILGWRVDW